MPSFGEEIRRERELRGIPLRDVAEATKISLRHLQALEADDFEHLPGGVFNRGFVRAYSQFIGVDPDSMVDAYLLEEQSQAAGRTAEGPDAFHRPRNGFERGASARTTDRSSRGRRHGTWIWALAIVALLVVAAGVAYFVFGWPTARGPSVPEPAAVRDDAGPAGRPR